MKLSKYRAIYIQIPKTGCGSISSIIQQSGGHRPASWVKNRISKKEWVSRFRFAFVRHPFDRFQSTLAHFNIDAPAKQVLADPMKFGIPPTVLYPQSWYLDERVDYIGDFDKFEEEWELIASILKIKEPLPRNNQSFNKKRLSQEDKAYLLYYYRDDFRRFHFNPSRYSGSSTSENHPA